MRLHILPRDLKLDGLRADPWRRREDGGWAVERHGSLFEVVVANRLDVDLVKAAPRYELRRDGVIEGRFGSDDEARGAVDKLRGAGAAQGQLFQAEPVSLHDRFGAVAEPAPGTRAFRPLSDVDVRAFGMASAMLMAAHALMQEPELKWAWDAEMGVVDDLDDLDGPDVDDDRFTLADLVGVPAQGATGRPLDAREQADLAVLATALAMHVWGRADVDQQWRVGGSGRGGKAIGADLVSGSFALPEWAALAVLVDALNDDAELRLVPVTKRDAFDFVKRHHSALPDANPRGLLFAIGVARGARLVGVALCNAPTARYADPHGVVELTRVATDGTVKGAASKLVARVLDVWQLAARTAPSKLVTYSLSSEEGATYKALADKGLRPVAKIAGRDPGGARGGVVGDPALARQDKIRWEAGPAAGPADWSLVAPSRA